MDINKLKVLTNIGYSFQETCATCYYGKFNSNDFGVCKKFKYKHQKHSEKERQISINKNGKCDFYECNSSFELEEYFKYIIKETK